MTTILARPVRVSRATATYNVHAYHTKVPAEAIIPYLEHYTRRGDVCLDPFAGSGMTGVAAALSGRRAILNDLSPAAVHIARNYTTPCDPDALEVSSRRLLAWSEPQIQPLYAASCPTCGAQATTEYVVWSDLRACPHCSGEVLVWENHDQGGRVRDIRCPHCAAQFDKNAAKLTGERPVQVNLSCSNCRARQSFAPRAEDFALTLRSRSQVPFWYPDVSFGSDWEMWRGGHRDLGIVQVADFWSHRNLAALSVLFEGIGREPDQRLRSALMFAFTGILNRASRRYQWNAKRPTNVLGGTLYIASLRYEFNVLSLFRRKLAAVTKYYRTVRLPIGAVEVIQGSATDLASVPDASVDYCFADPPFGANIYYADASLLWESWLTDFTDRSLEAVVSRRREGKKLGDYQELMTRSFAEMRRCLKPEGFATIVFQNTDEAVWRAIQDAALDAGLRLLGASTLHKSQPSFKGIKAIQSGERVAASDVVLTLSGSSQHDALPVAASTDADVVVREALRQELHAASSARLRTTAHLYAVAMSSLLGAGLDTQGWSFDRVAVLANDLADAPIEQLELKLLTR
jgi:16S rRNA G966 N2-methylase RsmD/DNA-directed RNA polymerase subunit RPC12/RpoP